MRPASRYFAASVVAVALGVAPGLAQAQSTSTSGSSSTQSGTSSSGTTTTGTTTSGTTMGGTQSATSSTGTSASAGVDEAAAREHLSQARQALAELTKLPAAAQLQGEQRTTVANFIQAFNAFATATTDWRPKFQAVNQQLEQILASADANGSASGTAGTTAGSTTGSTSSAANAGTAGATGATGSASASGSLDPTIVAKLREVKQHLDAFQEASGDPTPHYDAIEKIIDSAMTGTSGSASASVGTSGTSASTTAGDASASGSVTMTRAQLDQIRQHVEKLRALTDAAAAAAAKKQ